MAYLNIIIIYLISKREYKEYIKWVLKRLQKERMLVVIKKCKFFIRKTNFVRFIIELSKISIDLKKVKAIVNQQELENVTQLRLFLGFYNYYRKFITIGITSSNTYRYCNSIRVVTDLINT